MIKFSIIIVNYKSVDLVFKAIESIVNYSKKSTYEVLVIDNASGDDFSLLTKFSTINLKIIRNEGNFGFGKAINIAFEESIGELVLLLNPDAYFLNDVLAVFDEFYESNSSKNKSILGGSIYNPEGNSEVSYGNFPSMLFDALNLCGLTKLFPSLKKEYSTSRHVHDKVVEPFLVDYVSGALCCIPSNVFKELNGFDSDFFLYFEETELLRRHYKRGGTCFIIPKARVAHKTSSVIGQNSDFKLRNLEIGRYLYFKKTSTPLSFFLYKPLRSLVLFVLFFIKRRSVYLNLCALWLAPKFSKVAREHHSKL